MAEMTKEQLIELLKDGKVEEFNQYRDGTDYAPIDLTGAELYRAILTGVELYRADLTGADFSGADLTGANLTRANLSKADFREANLTRANLTEANLSRAHLNEVNFDQALVEYTTFAGVDLSEVKGLESVRHQGQSEVGIHTIYNSGGKIPEVFLRGCGVPEDFIEYMRSLTAKHYSGDA